MRCSSPLLLSLAAAAALHAPDVPAVVTTLQMGRIEGPGFNASGVEVELTWNERNGLALKASAQDLALSASVHLPQAQIRCARVEWTDAQVTCADGAFASTAGAIGEAGGRLEFSYRFADGAFRFALRDTPLAKGVLQVRGEGDRQSWRATVNGHALDIAAVRALVEKFRPWPAGYSGEAGIVDIDAQLSGRAAAWETLHVVTVSKGLSFNGGAIADNVGARLEATLKPAVPGVHIEAVASLERGALYVEPGFTYNDFKPGFTFEPGDAPIRLDLRAQFDPDRGALRVDDLRFDQPHVAQIGAQGAIVLGSVQPLQTLRLRIRQADVKEIYANHLKSLCSHIDTLCGLEMEGRLSGDIVWESDGVKDINLRFGEFYLDDNRHRFRIAGLNGDLVLNSGATEARSSLTWQGAGVYRLNLGGGRVTMASHDRTLTVTEWTDVKVLGGDLKLDALELANVGTRDLTVNMKGVLTPISMEDFCQAMGWPIMSGRLSGIIPGLSYRRGILSLDGDLLMRLFGGDVVIRGLRIDNPFGQSPLLRTDVDIVNIDLEQLTGAFSFGKIEGRLQGAIHKLRLENWSPTYFEAHLETPPGDKTRHRISQKAVDNLSAIGSGGVTTALSRGFLRVFKDYSYDRLGLSCRLYNGVCEMNGIAPAPDGFYIVTRGGLLPPWIDVKGTGPVIPDSSGYAIPWSDLTYGLKRIASGEMNIQ